MISWKEGEKGGMRVAKNKGVKEGGSESRREGVKEGGSHGKRRAEHTLRTESGHTYFFNPPLQKRKKLG